MQSRQRVASVSGPRTKLGNNHRSRSPSRTGTGKTGVMFQKWWPPKTARLAAARQAGVTGRRCRRPASLVCATLCNGTRGCLHSQPAMSTGEATYLVPHRTCSACLHGGSRKGDRRQWHFVNAIRHPHRPSMAHQACKCQRPVFCFMTRTHPING